MEAPTLSTERLILRSFETGDISAFAEIMTDKEAMKDLYFMDDGLPDEPIGFATWFVNDAITSWHQSGFGHWAICEKPSDSRPDQKVIGFAGFFSAGFQFGNPEEVLEVGWGIHPEFGRRGLATEASVAVLDYGFDVIQINKIMAITNHGNSSSWRLMERLGMMKSDDSSPYGHDDWVLYTVANKQWGH